MRRADLKQLHNKTREELQVMVRDTRDKLSQTLIDLAQNKLKDTSTIQRLRDDVARILTVISASPKTPRFSAGKFIKEKEGKNAKNFNR